MNGEIRSARGPRGETLHLVPFPPQDLPSVSRFHLERAWEAARQARPAPLRHFRFAAPGAAPLELALVDRDAAAWAAAAATIAALSTPYGISLCLRLLGLVALLAGAEWMRPWLTLDAAGAALHPALLRAAALAPLTPSGGFAETSLRALLP